MQPWKIALVCAGVIISAGCGGADCGEPLYEGGTQDEAFRAMVDAERSTARGDERAVTVVSPADGQSFPVGSVPPTFTWSSPIRSADARFRVSPPRRNLWDRIRGLVIADAYAHGEPYTGDLYDVSISIPGESCPVRVLTGNVSWTPSEEVWERIASAPGERVLSIVSAYLRDNRVTEGPFAPESETRFEMVAQ